MPFVVGQNVMVQVDDGYLNNTPQFAWIEGVVFEAEYSTKSENVYVVVGSDGKDHHVFEPRLRPFFFTRDLKSEQPTKLGH